MPGNGLIYRHIGLDSGGLQRRPEHAEKSWRGGNGQPGVLFIAPGLANRLCESGTALKTAIGLAEEISSFPQTCMRGDRKSVLEQWSLDTEAAILNETRIGMETINSGETVSGASRFSSGEGKHGKFQE